MQKFGDFRLDSANECLWRSGRRLTLTPRPFAVLRYLVDNSQRLVTYDELLEELWPDTYVQPQVLRTYILEIRRLLGDTPGCPQFVETVAKRGYRFLAPVTFEGEAARQRVSFCGRGVEMSELHAALARAEKGERPTVFLTGETGIGKTALIDAFCERVCKEHAPVRVARGQSSEGFGGKEPFYSVREAMSSLCAADDVDTRAILANALPAWFTRSGAEAPSLSEICEALERASERKSLLLILEDIHQADALTLDLIAVLARRRARARIMLLASFRDADVRPQHPLRDLQRDLVGSRRWDEIRLGRLDRSAVSAYVRCRLNADKLPEGLTSLVHQRSGGNPLYMTAMVDSFCAQGLVRNDNGQVVLKRALNEIEPEINDGLAGVVELQLDRLSEKDRRLLEAGSIAGAIFPAWAAAAALSRGVEEMEEAYAALARRVRLISIAGYDELPDGSRSTFYVFAHALYSEAIYRTIPIYRRSQWHRRIADQLRIIFAGREASVAYEIATHIRASELQTES
jgi:predicted ATPase